MIFNYKLTNLNILIIINLLQNDINITTKITSKRHQSDGTSAIVFNVYLNEKGSNLFPPAI